MLSNPSSSLQQRQRQHRRQNSTPTALQAPKVPLLPATPLQRNGSTSKTHRRGQSLDLRPSQSTPRLTTSIKNPPQQDDISVSINPGFQPIPNRLQHVLREAQQQRLGRPDQLPQQVFDFPSGQGLDDSPPDYIEACLSSSNNGLGNAALSLHSQRNNVRQLIQSQSSGRLGLGPQQQQPLDGFDLESFSKTNPDAVAAYLNGFGMGLDENRYPLQQLQGGNPGGFGLKRTQSQRVESTKRWSRQRPTTPPQQSMSGDLPMTPEATPHGPTPFLGHTNRRSIVFPLSKDETIKARPRTLQRAGTCRDLYEAVKRQEEEQNALPSPPGTGTLIPSSTFDMAPMPSSDSMSMDNLNLNVSASDNDYESSYYSPLSTALSPSQSSFLSSPEMEQLQLFGNALDAVPDLSKNVGRSSKMLPMSQSSANLSGVDDGSPMKGGMPERSLSVADLNLDASIKDTGITVDDISTFIEGPDPTDGKWVCLFPECNKKFGRKENIKSHVQTHLGDRQYRCNHCRKCFVRQHDLKRHAKIHSGVKPYPCACGNSFARHDALTRHRQRGMCVGAFEGVVKKVVKRGRPRKNRPEADERKDKASTTRKHQAIALSQTSSSSSLSCYQSSPPAYENSVSSRDMSPFELLTQEFEATSNQPALHQAAAFNDPHTPPMSPSRQLQAFISPKVIQQSSPPRSAASPSRSPQRHSIATIPEEPLQLPSHPPSPGKSSSSQRNTPPDLYLSSSSPHSAKFFDLNEATSPIGPGSQPSDAAPAHTDALAAFDFGLPDIAEQSTDDMFVDFSGEVSTTDKNPSQMALDAFEEAFAAEQEMFQNDTATFMF